MKAYRAEAEELQKQVDVAKIEAHDAKALARADKRNRKRREKRDLGGDQPALGLEDREVQPGNPRTQRSSLGLPVRNTSSF